MEKWHSISAKEALGELGSDAGAGLSSSEVEKRLAQHGENTISSGKKISVLKLLLEQFTSPLVLVLIAAGAVSFFFEKGIDAILIIAIVILNGLFGFAQNYNAEKSIEALKKMGAPKALVQRNGEIMEINSRGLVPGDIILLREGFKVPADCRLFEGNNLRVDESILTGESAPVGKAQEAVSADAVLAERKCMLYMDTLVVRGTAKAIVVGTGNSTEVGKIAKTLDSIEDEPTRFNTEVDVLGKKIGKVVLVLAVIIAGVVYFFHNAGPVEAFIFSVSLAVAAIPEGLPAVVTLSLALTTRKMLKHNSLVRKLPVVESLGSVDVICTDKTGTMTENSMTVKEIYCAGKFYEVTGAGRETTGEFLSGGKKADAAELENLLLCGAVCNDTIIGKNESGASDFSGDPTEIALIVSAKKAGVSYANIKRISEIPFSSEKKRMTVVTQNWKTIAYAKGAPEVIAASCTHALENGKKVALTEPGRAKILQANEKMASKALRVLGFAYKEMKSAKDDAESAMVFLGLQGMIDPPRAEVADAIRTAKDAGIRVVMLTGDNNLTAKAIAAQIGLGGEAIDGGEVAKFSEQEFHDAVMGCNVFARVSPEQKFSILKHLQQKGFSVAMTGDGVNDAPALKQSDVGIAMGIRGSDVAKEASDIVLLDDNFATIVEAVRQGRSVFDNIQKFVFFLLSSNLAEVMIVFITALAGYISLTPVMLLWINLVTAGLPALALGADEPKPDIMKRKPRSSNEQIINKQTALKMLAVSVIFTIITLGIFFYYLPSGLELAQTVSFCGLVAFEFLIIGIIKKEEGVSVFANKWLLAALAISVILQLAVIYTPLSGLFGVVPLALNDWLVIIAGGILAFITSNIAISAINAKRSAAHN